MLMVNAEARYEALKVFHPFFGPQLNKLLYFDEEHDTLYFERKHAMQLWKEITAKLFPKWITTSAHSHPGFFQNGLPPVLAPTQTFPKLS